MKKKKMTDKEAGEAFLRRTREIEAFHKAIGYTPIDNEYFVGTGFDAKKLEIYRKKQARRKKK